MAIVFVFVLLLLLFFIFVSFLFVSVFKWLVITNKSNSFYIKVSANASLKIKHVIQQYRNATYRNVKLMNHFCLHVVSGYVCISATCCPVNKLFLYNVVSGTETLGDMIEKMIGKRPNIFFLICWKYVSPIATLVRLFYFGKGTPIQGCRTLKGLNKLFFGASKGGQTQMVHTWSFYGTF